MGIIIDNNFYVYINGGIIKLTKRLRVYLLIDFDFIIAIN